MNKLIAAAAVLVALTGTAFAEGSSLTSKELFGACSTPEPKRPAELGNKPTREQITERAIAWMGYHKTMRDVQSCRYYILGIADGITTFSDLYGVTDCVPSGTRMGDLADLYVKYYKDHPERRHYDAKELVTSAFVDAFSCRFDPRKTTGNKS